jgi:hypothetical protein
MTSGLDVDRSVDSLANELSEGKVYLFFDGVVQEKRKKEERETAVCLVVGSFKNFLGNSVK